MPVGEILLSAFFQVLFDRLASRDLLNSVRRLLGGVDSQLKKWKDSLIMIQAVLSDAEEKQLTDRTGALKIWLDGLRDLAYDAEDILDELTTEDLKRKLMLSKVQNLINRINPRTVHFIVSMRSKIKDITSRLEELCKQRIELGLQLTTTGAGGTSTDALRKLLDLVNTVVKLVGTCRVAQTLKSECVLNT